MDTIDVTMVPMTPDPLTDLLLYVREAVEKLKGNDLLSSVVITKVMRGRHGLIHFLF